MEAKENYIKKLNECNIAYEFEKMYQLIKDLINSGVSIKEIDDLCPNLPVYRIINNIISYGKDNETTTKAIIDYYNDNYINQDRCIIVSDNHMGRLMYGEKDTISCHHENERGIHFAYEHAYKHGIKNIIHLGDLIEGHSQTNRMRIKDNNHQLEYLRRYYPNYPDIKTYLLYGNHDFNFIYWYIDNPRFYKLCTNMELIGVNYSYINFCGYPIKLSHESTVSNYLKNLDLPYDFELSGHSHTYKFFEDQRLIKVPCLSSASTDGETVGFLEMINEEKEFLFKFYDQNDNEIPQNEKVLRKNTNN